MNKDEKLSNILKSGRVAVIPTDTIYGIVGKALDEKTVERIYEVKKRKPEKPFIILISNQKELEEFSINLNEFQKNYLSENWPGPVSVILPCKRKELRYLHRGTDSLAFRLPNDETLKNLISLTGPLVAPSANPEGKEPADTIEKAKEYFKDEIDCYIDGGRIKSNPSRLVLIDGDVIKILR
jgi:L-threonylcarbamoyladenylate synthase